MTLPGISIIIPTYNEEKKIVNCINSIKSQEYKGDFEIIIVDDNSNDQTIEIASNLGCRILMNGTYNIERGKSIGIQNATFDYIFLMDADNILPDKDWLESSMIAFQENEGILGVQASKFKYDKNHSISDRYCELFGINDPTVYYLKKQDKLKWTDQKWKLNGDLIRETESYFLVQYTIKNFVTVGSQGFLTKKELIFKTTYKPLFFHMDSNLELLIQGYKKIVFLKKSVEHLHSETIFSFINKLKRNFELFNKQKDKRKFRYDIDSIKMLKLGFIMLTGIVPFIDSTKGFIRKPDFAWFLHPIFCFWVGCLYTFMTIKFKLMEYWRLFRN